MFSAALFITAKLVSTKMSFNRRIDKQTIVHPDNRMLFSDKKNQVIPTMKRWRNHRCTLPGEST